MTPFHPLFTFYYFYFSATHTVYVNAAEIALEITSPVDGTTVFGPDIMVQGIISNSTGNETGITVNGVVALVSGNSFYANHVPLVEGENSITAMATDTSANVRFSSITVHADSAGDYVSISADAESGLAPFEVNLSIAGSFVFMESSLSFTGPGQVEIVDSSSDTYSIRITTSGIYTLTAEVTDQGTTYTDTVAVQVMDATELDTLLRGKWDMMKAALVAGDIEGAVQEFTPYQHQVFREIFTITQDNLDQMALEMQDIEFIYQKNETAEYRIKRDVLFNGVPETITFYIYFQKGAEGIWRIRDF